MDVKIEWREEKGPFNTSIKNTSIPQREKQEEIIKNLCRYLNIKIVFKVKSSREAVFYCLEGKKYYQSATNTILELSELIMKIYKPSA